MKDDAPLPPMRERLIDAGIALMAEGGIEAMTVRQVAARAGVSHAAPGHHFRTLAHLRSAIAAKGHRQFAAMMEEEIAKAPPAPRPVLVAALRGYVRFAQSSPAVFTLMFGGYQLAEDAEFAEAAGASYGVLARISAPFAPGPLGAEGTEMMVWSLAHGFASLVLAGWRSETQPEISAEDYIAALVPELPLGDRA